MATTVELPITLRRRLMERLRLGRLLDLAGVLWSISMASDESDEWLRDPELARLRREWIHAYRIWRSVVGEAASVGEALTDEQRVAERRYQEAEIAYFARSRRLTDSQSESKLA